MKGAADLNRSLIRSNLNRSNMNIAYIASPLGHLKVKLPEPIPVLKPAHQAESTPSQLLTGRSCSAPLIRPEMVFIQPKSIPSSNERKKRMPNQVCIESQTSIAHITPASWERSLIVQAGTAGLDSVNTESKSLQDQPTSVEFRPAVSRKASIHEKSAVFKREVIDRRSITSLRMKAFKCKQNTSSDDAPEDEQSNLDSELDTIKTSKCLAKLFMQSADKEARQVVAQVSKKRSSRFASKDSPETESIHIKDKYTQDNYPTDRPSQPTPSELAKSPIRSILSLNPKHSPQVKNRVLLARITKNLPVKRVSFSPTRTVFFVRK
jgi:hypothetical protein